MREAIILNQVMEKLGEAGFAVSKRCKLRSCHSCFDIAARRGKNVIIINALTNLGSVSKESAYELNLIAYKLSATPLIIALSTPKGRMGDDAVYERHGVPSVTPQTLIDAIVRDHHPIVEAKPGGFYVQLDGKAIRKRRLSMGLSLGDLASMVGVTRRTIYGYERELAKASVGVALKLEAVLGIPAVKQIDLFKKSTIKMKSTIVKQAVKNKSMKTISEKFSNIGFSVSFISRAPFDFIALGREGQKVIGGFAEANEKEAEERLQITASVAEVIKCQPFFIFSGKEPLTNRITSICWKEFLRIKLNDLCNMLH